MATQSYPVASSAIARLEYDDGFKFAYVTFHRGGSYIIQGIEQIEVERWANSSSPGSYFNTNIKGKY